MENNILAEMFSSWQDASVHHMKMIHYSGFFIIEGI